MYKQKKPFWKFILSAFLFSALLIACRKDKTDRTNLAAFRFTLDEKSSVSEEAAPPAQIMLSEHLLIPEQISVPANLPLGNTRIATYFAEGVQKYKAQVKSGSNPVAYEWVFVAPQADLYDSHNKKVGTHSAGPFWQLSANDSIFAQHYSPAKTAASPDNNSIDWLLLMPKAGKTPTGIFADVLYIQRIATKGGKAPATLPTGPNETIEVQYTAVYRFTKKNQ